VSPTVAPQALLPEGLPQARSTPGLTDWKQARAIRGVTSGSLFLPVAVLFAILASYFIGSAWNYGSATYWIIGGIFLLVHHRFFSGWLNSRRNQFDIHYNDEVMVFQEFADGSYATRFKSLLWIDQDRRGYTLVLELGDRFRLLRRDMQPDLQGILDSHQHRLKCEALVNHAPSLAT
jgi:hypothetical protein